MVIVGGKASLKTHKRIVKSGEIHTHQYFICGRKSENYHNCENGRISSKIIIPLITKSIKEECSKIVFSKGDITSIYEQAKEISNNKKVVLKTKIEREEKEIHKIEKKLEQIYADKLDNVITSEDFSRFYNSYQENKENILIKISTLKQQFEKVNNEKLIEYKRIKEIAEQCLNMEELNQELLNKLIDRVEYYKGKKIKIIYKFMESK